MKSYLTATGVIFGLVSLAHVWRMVEEPHLATDPWFIGLTLVAAALCVAAFSLLRRVTPR